MISFHDEATPICGFSQSSSPMPTARSIPRAAAFSRPSVTSRLRGLMSGVARSCSGMLRRRRTTDRPRVSGRPGAAPHHHHVGQVARPPRARSRRRRTSPRRCRRGRRSRGPVGSWSSTHIASRITPTKKRLGQPRRRAAPRCRRRRGSATRARRPRAGSDRRAPPSGKTKTVSGSCGCDDDREAEVGGQPVGDGLPESALVVGAVDAAVVLGEQPLGSDGWRVDLVHALAELGVLLALGQELRPDARGCAAPTTRRRRGSGRRRRSRSRRSPTRGSSGAAAGCGRPGRRSRRPTRCGAGGPTARARASKVCAAVVGPEDRGRLGAGPHHVVARARARSCQTRSTEASGVLGEADAPSGRSCQVWPRSSELNTCGPGPAQRRHRPAAVVRSPRVSTRQE